ncbi:chemotaxis protein CheD [Jannaschia donghaensis]|uniref:Probable chemoreceptor glutamine deamidase CheD n=1 Tax=Jannaschia donghaensis TaxID=420998 RepID=A0A0M6YJV8_9RHOB|nr:chemotaxis protein CheD [Jannaschia donghaensis]CTQ50641.1 Chemoreceptor glutamine deamidase CheD [Jannaschia donghaensis]
MRESAIRQIRDPTVSAGSGASADRWLEVGQGAFVVSRDPYLVLTATLGSCVAVIFYDAGARIGGMTHIFRCVDPGPAGGGAVVAEIEMLVNALMREGSPRSILQARVVGGAHILNRGRNVGGAMAHVALEYLQAERIDLVDHDVGGIRARRIAFNPVAGGLMVSYPGSMITVAEPSDLPARDDSTELF